MANDDPFDSAPERGEFVKLKHLGASKDDRLLIVFLHALGVAPSNQGGTYEYVDATVIPVDGPTDERVTAVGVEAAKQPIQMRLSGAGVIDGLKLRLRQQQIAKVERPILTRLNWVPAKMNDEIKVWGFTTKPVSAADKALAMPVLDQYNALKADAVDPFAA